MNLTLRQARRVEHEIEASLSTLFGALKTRNVEISIYEDFNSVVAHKQKTVVEALDTYEKLSGIRYAIRSAIKTDNEVSGANILMNEEVLLKDQAKILDGVICPEFTKSEYEICKARWAKMADGKTPSIYGGSEDKVTANAVLQATTLATLKLRMKINQRRRLVIVDELTALNTSRKISVPDEDITYLETFGVIV